MNKTQCVPRLRYIFLFPKVRERFTIWIFKTLKDFFWTPCIISKYSLLAQIKVYWSTESEILWWVFSALRRSSPCHKEKLQALPILANLCACQMVAVAVYLDMSITFFGKLDREKSDWFLTFLSFVQMVWTEQSSFVRVLKQSVLISIFHVQWMCCKMFTWWAWMETQKEPVRDVFERLYFMQDHSACTKLECLFSFN